MGEAPEPEAELPAASTLPTFSEDLLREQLQLFLMGLAYDRGASGELAGEMVAWKDDEGNPLIGAWEAELFHARKSYEEGNTTIDELVEKESWIAIELGRRIKKEVPEYNVSNWDLRDVIDSRDANCVGYTQLFYMLGNAIGLDVIPIEVLESQDLREGHVTALVNLSDGQTVMVELTSDTAYVSQPFVLQSEFISSGKYLEVPNKAKSKFPHSRIRLMNKDGMMAALFISRGTNLNAQGVPEKALAEYIVAIELDPEYALAYNNRGATLQRLGYASDALFDLNMAIVLNPYHAEAYSNRGVVHIDTENFTEAISDFERAFDLGGGNGLLYYNRGLAYYYLKEHDAAISDFDTAIEKIPDHAKAYYNRAGAYSELNEYESALSDYGMAIEIDPTFAEAYSGRGTVHSDLKDYKSAIDDYDMAIEFGLESYATYFNRGNAHYNTGEYQKALDDYTKTIELKQDLTEAFIFRGYTYKKLGDQDSAKNDFDIATLLDPDFKQ
jgi:tetratricopeptide (TPR) repeat protein